MFETLLEVVTKAMRKYLPVVIPKIKYSWNEKNNCYMLGTKTVLGSQKYLLIHA